MYLPDIYISDREIVGQITEEEALRLNKGAVILVRSDYGAEKYGDHASLIFGGLIEKSRGLRPNLLILPSVFYNISKILDQYIPINGKTLILLNENSGPAILKMLGGMHLSEGELINYSISENANTANT